MHSVVRKLFILTLLCFCIININAQTSKLSKENEKALDFGIGLLERYFERDHTWQVTDNETGESVRGLIYFINKQPIDSIFSNINNSLYDDNFRFVYRLPEFVSDSLNVSGYYSNSLVNKQLLVLEKRVHKKYYQDDLPVPVSLLSDLDKKAGIIERGEGRKLFDAGYYELPDSLKIPDVVPDSLMQSPKDFRQFLKLDSIRNSYIELKRMSYNDSVVNACRDSIIDNYRRERFEQEFSVLRQHLKDSVRVNNYQVIKTYNDSIIMAVNDSISFVLGELVEYADFIDTTSVTMTNLVGDKSKLLLQSNSPYSSRVWLKNEQNDSLQMLIKSTGKRSMQFFIDDGVTFSRFKPKETKDFDFSSLKRRGPSGLTGVSEKYKAFIPWRFGGDASMGFTQTYLDNWKKGGQSALSLQIILKGYANYSNISGKVKWENSAEIRNGYMNPGGEDAEWQKNDDKVEFTSRFGLSAFKKWYYSAEYNFETQFFNGYKYPKSTNPDPISAFMAPARTFFKLGFDYKPNNRLSLLLSPITAKNVFVRDTAKIDQTKFGVDVDKKGFWDIGLNADFKYKKNITPDITYETKYKMFINYGDPFSDLDINWENQMVMKLTDHIHMRMLVHLIYDTDVLFPITDENNKKIGEEPRLQVKEFVNIGFTYKINKKVTKTKRKK